VGTKTWSDSDSRLQTLRNEINSRVSSLAKLSPKEVKKEIRAVERAWRLLSEDIDTMLINYRAVAEIQKYINNINDEIPILTAASDELVGTMFEYRASSIQTYIATRQLMLVQRITLNLKRMSSDERGVAKALDRFGRDVSLFRRITTGMMTGTDKKLQIEHIKDPVARKKLDEVNVIFQRVNENTNEILKRSPEWLSSIDATYEIVIKSNELELEIAALLGESKSLSKANPHKTSIVTKNNWCDKKPSNKTPLNRQTSLLKEFVRRVDISRGHIREYALGESQVDNELKNDIRLLVSYEDMLLDGNQECGVEKLSESRLSNNIKIHFTKTIDEW